MQDDIFKNSDFADKKRDGRAGEISDTVRRFTVSKDGNAMYATIQEALAAAQAIDAPLSSIIIHIAPGVYRERLEIHQSRLTLEGEDPMTTKILWGDYANEILADGEKRGTFRTPTLFVDADHVCLKNLTVENDAGPGKKVGQALALYADGDCLSFLGCRFLGWQDTIFTAPLPPCAYEKNGFRGPKEFAPRKNSRQYFKDCYICGEVDFIFGGATAFFEDCEIHSLDIGEPINGYATAASTPQGRPYGYVFFNCRFTGSCPDKTAYLGRPWREYAKTVLIRCEIGPHIRPEGFDDWGKTDAHDTIFYGEYQCYGPGAAGENRPDWVKTLTDQEAKNYTLQKVLEL